MVNGRPRPSCPWPPQLRRVRLGQPGSGRVRTPRRQPGRGRPPFLHVQPAPRPSSCKRCESIGASKTPATGSWTGRQPRPHRPYRSQHAHPRRIARNPPRRDRSPEWASPTSGWRHPGTGIAPCRLIGLGPKPVKLQSPRRHGHSFNLVDTDIDPLQTDRFRCPTMSGTDRFCGVRCSMPIAAGGLGPKSTKLKQCPVTCRIDRKTALNYTAVRDPSFPLQSQACPYTVSISSRLLSNIVMGLTLC